MHYQTGNTPPTHSHYDNLDGNIKNFTHIDHDKKLKVAVGGKESLEDLQESLRQYKQDNIERILLLPAYAILVGQAPERYEEFVIRDLKSGEIKWNETVVRNYCETVGMYENYVLHLRVWRGCAKFEYWWSPIPTLEEMKEGKHKDMLASFKQNI
jgi:hypothetical protein